MKKARRRVRPTLLVLLWIWALCVFVVIDLFRNVPAFDRIRPSADVYRATRFAAHKLVGEPYLDGGFRDELPAERPEVRPDPLDVVRDPEASRADRVAACRALGRAGAARDLEAAALDDAVPTTVRFAAVEELEKLDFATAYAALRAVSGSGSRIVSRRAWIARARLEQRRAERKG
jgi:hypothetical protein